VDGSVTAFVIKSVESGTLLLGNSIGTATPWVAGSNDTLTSVINAYWTPATNATGVLTAFTVVAKDNSGVESYAAIPVNVAVAALTASAAEGGSAVSLDLGTGALSAVTYSINGGTASSSLPTGLTLNGNSVTLDSIECRI